MSRPSRPSFRPLRTIRILGYAALHFGRLVLPPVLSVAAYLVIATVVLRWDLKRVGEVADDFQTTLYSVYRQLFFEPVEALPARPIGRAMVWVTPLVGLVLVAQGLVKVASAMFDGDARRNLWDSIMTDQMRGHIVVCGMGHVGYRVVEELRRLGEEIVGLELSEDGSFIEVVRGWGIPVYIGDARRDEMLVKCGVARARAVVCATSNDLANLEIALDSKRMNPAVRVVMRMFDQKLAGKVGGALDLDESFSTSALSAPLIAIQATHDGVLSAYRVGDQVRVLAEATVGASMAGETISAAEDKVPCRVVQRRHADDVAFGSVKARDVLAEKDVLILDAAAVDLGAVRRRLGA